MTPERAGAQRFAWAVPEGWQQGRGAFGGLVLGAMVRAIEASAASPDRTLRSLTAELPGPALPGPAPIDVEALRAGSGQSTIAARVTQDGEVKAHCVAILARPRALDVPAGAALAPPALPPWRGVELIPMGEEIGPVFARHMEFRNVGPLPASAARVPAALGWARARVAPRAIDAEMIVAMCDQWWPALLSSFDTFRPMATVAYTLQITGPLDRLDPEIPFAYRGTVLAQHEGWTVEQRELWSPDGRLLALNQQTFAIVK